jgi:uncharacterized protein involved in exopolysaccharide biosynthesis
MRDDPILSAHGAHDSVPADDDGFDLLDIVVPLVEHWRLLIAGSLAVGVLALGITYLISPTFTARTSFLPPQPPQSSAAAALASLGGLAGLVSGSGSRSPAEQYVALMQSSTVMDRLVDRFKLMSVYEVDFRADARRVLATQVHFTVGKKDGLITVEVDDKVPQRAADLANAHIDELRRLTSQLALTEAQQRRMFFERHLEGTKDRLTQAQQALQASGFNPGALKAEPRAAAESYARLRAEATAAEVRLQTLRRALAEDTPEVQQQQAMLSALRSQLAKAEQATDTESGPDYVGKYREFKYQETLFELFSRQYEMARVDESREGALIQVVDEASPPERKSRPKRAIVAVSATIVAGLLLGLIVLLRNAWRQAALQPHKSEQLSRIRAALRLRR